MRTIGRVRNALKQIYRVKLNFGKQFLGIYATLMIFPQNLLTKVKFDHVHNYAKEQALGFVNSSPRPEAAWTRDHAT